MRRCPECGQFWDDSEPFCRHCGRDLSDADRVDPQQAMAQESRGGSLVTILILALCVMMIVPMVMGFLNPPVSPGHTDLDKEYAWEFQGQSFSVSLSIDEADLKAAESTTLPRTGSAYAEAPAGMHAAKEYVVVGRTVMALCDALWKEYSDFVSVSGNEQYNNAVDFANYLLAFVNTVVTYQDDPTSSDGSNEYWRLPVETLYLGYGDCEDTSILMSAICNCMSTLSDAEGRAFAPGGYIEGACIFMLPGHAMAGVSLSSEPSGGESGMYSADIDGTAYYFCETTADTDFDRIYVGYLSQGYHGANALPFIGYVNSYA